MSGANAPPNGIVYFHYERSPYARRVAWYLTFRQIAYAECIQPRIMPRPDLKALGVNYRRTPTMAIGRDFYLDSRMIIQKLEELFPPSEQHPAFSTKETAGLAALLNKLTIDASLFNHAVMIMPLESPAFKDKDFRKDRAGFFAPGWKLDDAKKARSEGLTHVRQCFGIIESLFADGRPWIGGTEKPTLADLEGIWAIDWVISDLMPPKEYFTDEIYPKVYSWRNRFREELDAAKIRAPEPVRLEGVDAVSAVLGADYADTSLFIDPGDPAQLKEGATVELYPTDTGGFTHQDRGRLIKLTKDEVAVSVKSQLEDRDVHVHAPRWNFRVQEVGKAKL